MAPSDRILARWDAAKFMDSGVRVRAEVAYRAALSGKLDFPTFERELLRAELDDRELQIIRAERPRGPAIHSSTRDTSAPVIEAALCRSAGLPSAALEKSFKPEVLEGADRQYRGGLGLQEVLIRAALANGYTGGRTRITSGNITEVLRAAFAAPIQAAFSTLDVSGILSNTANKMLLDGFNQVESVWRDISIIRPVKDFKAAV